jgi:hypothetical protein
MNVLTLLAMTFAIAFVAPVARYAYRKWLVDCWESATAAVKRGQERTKDLIAASAEKEFDPREFAFSGK